jgi:predicted amidohydrolase
MSEVVVACCQLSLRVGDVAGNRELARAAIDDAARRGAQVILVPELANSGYVFEDRDEAVRCAEPLDGPTVWEWTALAREHRVIVVGGLCEDGPGERLSNSSMIVDGEGVRAVYRKAHLWDREKLVFEPGDVSPPVVDTMHGRLSTVVCYDLEFPEWVRLAALDGAELVCAPTNWPREPRPAGERPAVVFKVQADASVNRVFIAACDRAGEERGVEWENGTVIVGPDGFPLAGPVLEDRSLTIFASCDLSRARVKATSERNDVFADRRPELYDITQS